MMCLRHERILLKTELQPWEAGIHKSSRRTRADVHDSSRPTTTMLQNTCFRPLYFYSTFIFKKKKKKANSDTRTQQVSHNQEMRRIMKGSEKDNRWTFLASTRTECSGDDATDQDDLPMCRCRHISCQYQRGTQVQTWQPCIPSYRKSSSPAAMWSHFLPRMPRRLVRPG